MESTIKFLRRWNYALVASVLIGLVSLSPAADFKPTGHEDLDAIRQSIATEKTDAENYKRRVFMLK